MDQIEKLSQAFKALEESISKDAFAEVSDEEKYLMSYIPYGIRTIPMLEVAIGRQGLPVSKIIEVFGFEHCGKTTFTYHAIAEVQKMGGAALFIDTEQSFSKLRAEECGVNTEHPYLLRAGAKTIEAVIRLMENQIIQLKKVNFTKPFLIIVDSITGVTTEFEASREFSDEQRIGQEAKQIRAGLKKINVKLSDSKIPAIFVNHSISNIPKGPFAVKPSQSAGGHALKFFSDVRLELKSKGDTTKTMRGQTIKTGQKTQIKMHKNKVNKPTIIAFDVYLDNDFGFDFKASMFDALRFVGAIKAPNEVKDNTVCTYLPKTEQSHQFKREEWNQVMETRGGLDAMYKILYEYGNKENLIKPYGDK